MESHGRRDVGSTVFERYRIEGENGCSDTGIVYDAVDARTGKSVALEIATDVGNQDAREHLVRDALLAQRLEDVHVLRVLEAGVLTDGSPYVVREPALATLAGEVERAGAIEASQAVAWTLEVCEALAEAHALGMSHGDVRAETVCIGRDDDGNPIAKLAWTTKAKAEKAATEDLARDVAGAGLLLRYLLTGSNDAEEDSARTLPSELSYAVARATTADDASRFPNVGELAAAIARWAPPGHTAARDTAFILSRAGVSSLAPPTKPVQRAATTERERDDVGDSWFKVREQRVSLPAPPPPPRKGSSFAIVSLLLLALVAGGTIVLAKTNGLPQWSGSAPVLEKDPQTVEPVGRTELTGADIAETTQMTPPAALTSDKKEKEKEKATDAPKAPAPGMFETQTMPGSAQTTPSGGATSPAPKPREQKTETPAAARPTAPAETEEPSSSTNTTPPATSPFIDEPPAPTTSPSTEPPATY